MHKTRSKIIVLVRINTAQKMKFSIKDFFGKRDQIRRNESICAMKV